MKNIAKKLTLLLVFGTSLLNAMETTKPEKCPNELPYIMLYVDINKTIIIESTGKGFGYEEGVAALLSTEPEYAYTWGNDKKKITYNKWVDEQLFPGSNPTLKKKRESEHAQFIKAAKDHNHPMFKKINNEFESLVTALKEQYSRKIFTSFSNLITYLKKNNYSFSIILRTFGKDLDGTSKELAHDGLTFIHGSFQKGNLHLNNNVISDPAKMITAFKPGQHYAIQDSYDWWKEHNFTEKGGKPFPVDVSDKHILSIFFDDYAADPVKPILHIIPVGTKTNLNELIKMGRVVPVDVRKAILDKNYFINTVKNALEQWKATYCQ
jgi:hypothetical protein